MTDAPRSFPADAIHLVRTSQQIGLSLSQMADQKASILMGATFVVFTISVNQAARGPVSPALVVLALSAFVSAGLAVFAIMPSIGGGKGGGGAPNILFFGHYTARSEDEFADEVLTRLRDPETIYRTMLRDIYQNGQVLQHKKYKYLGAAYRAFLVGLVLTLAAAVGQWLGLL
ncbi:Pycsar system effector family protein [Sphingomonas sp. SUN039]|uniref:Pycsar system effector family protein n=1 Tax=Sphingomonas sp. SUN039 TaxID=2937787 RepID=UPI002164987D|nr:Pycsar system effector family protein [Sphingomonas sp. SUN039]UVO54429.1 DUF5706 domain-containing protein [Sphingomonas sp. SUN039]